MFLMVEPDAEQIGITNRMYIHMQENFKIRDEIYIKAIRPLGESEKGV